MEVNGIFGFKKGGGDSIMGGEGLVREYVG
jgi:hypothetical protein